MVALEKSMLVEETKKAAHARASKRAADQNRRRNPGTKKEAANVSELILYSVKFAFNSINPCNYLG